MTGPRSRAPRATAVVVVAAAAGCLAGWGISRSVRTARRSGVTDDEVAGALPGDDLLPDAQVVMDRAGSLPAPASAVWPWLVQLGKGRGGWYLTRPIERFIPPRRRALRHLDARWQDLSVGDRIADYGARDPEFEVAVLQPPRTLVFSSARRTRRGQIRVSWALVLDDQPGGSRLRLRLRLAGLHRPGLIVVVGGWFDDLTCRAMLAGLRERLGHDPPVPLFVTPGRPPTARSAR